VVVHVRLWNVKGSCCTLSAACNCRCSGPMGEAIQPTQAGTQQWPLLLAAQSLHLLPCTCGRAPCLLRHPPSAINLDSPKLRIRAAKRWPSRRDARAAGSCRLAHDPTCRVAR